MGRESGYLAGPPLGGGELEFPAVNCGKPLVMAAQSKLAKLRLDMGSPFFAAFEVDVNAGKRQLSKGISKPRLRMHLAYRHSPLAEEG